MQSQSIRGVFPPIEVINHKDGNLPAEIGDVAVCLGKALEVTTAVSEENRRVGAEEAILFPLLAARAEIEDVIRKVKRGGFNQQTSFDVTPLPEPRKQGLWRDIVAKNVREIKLQTNLTKGRVIA